MILPRDLPDHVFAAVNAAVGCRYLNHRARAYDRKQQRARHISAYILRSSGLTLAKVASMLNRDIGGVVYSIQTVQKALLYRVDAELRGWLSASVQALRGEGAILNESYYKGMNDE